MNRRVSAFVMINATTIVVLETFFERPVSLLDEPAEPPRQRPR